MMCSFGNEEDRIHGGDDKQEVQKNNGGVFYSKYEISVKTGYKRIKKTLKKLLECGVIAAGAGILCFNVFGMN